MGDKGGFNPRGFPALALALVISMPMFSCSWSEGDKYLFAGYASLSALDAYQASRIEDRGLREGNPLWARPDGTPDVKKLIVAKILGAGLILLILDRYPEDRRELLVVMNMIQGGVDVWNEYALERYGLAEHDAMEIFHYRSYFAVPRDGRPPETSGFAPTIPDYMNMNFSEAGE